jgi:hypothetical protein
VALVICMAGMLYLGIFPAGALASATAAVGILRF